MLPTSNLLKLQLKNTLPTPWTSYFVILQINFSQFSNLWHALENWLHLLASLTRSPCLTHARPRTCVCTPLAVQGAGRSANNERAHHAASQSGGGGDDDDGTHGHPAVDVFIFVWLTGGKQQNRATKDSTRLFSRFTFIICAAHGGTSLFRARGVHWRLLFPSGIMERARQSVSEAGSQQRWADARRLSERRRHSTCPAPNNGPRAPTLVWIPT